ncbi:MAG: OsmC family protein [Anaerolineae bacterium]|nr:OsmC family protein [Anaerolineae bacterium]
MTNVTVTNDTGYLAVARTRNHTWYADETIESGGTNTAPDPMEELLGALGGCVAITVRGYATRKNWPLEKIEVYLNIERFKASEYPGYQGDAQFVHEVREKIVLHGPLDETQHARLLEIATKCPVRRVLTTPVFFIETDQQPVSES